MIASGLRSATGPVMSKPPDASVSASSDAAPRLMVDDVDSYDDGAATGQSLRLDGRDLHRAGRHIDGDGVIQPASNEAGRGGSIGVSES